jgi:hypothetical protein
VGLPPRLRAGVEGLSGIAMDDVRVHRNSAEPAKLGALAFTRGAEIHLGPGQDEHLPHEAWHVVQQKQGRVQATTQMKGAAINTDVTLEHEADHAAVRLAHGVFRRGPLGLLSGATSRVIQRKEPDKKKAPTKEESETALGNTLRQAPFDSGFVLAFYDENAPEAERRASDFATRESSLGFSGKKPSAATIKVGKPIAGVFGIDSATIAVADVVAAALARVPAASGTSPANAAAPGKIKTIAIFAHGTPDWCSAGVTTSNAAAIFTKIAPKLAQDVTVILYTCNAARGPKEDEEWVKGTMEGGGKGSLAEVVRDTLVDQKVSTATVWGHTTTGHASHNPALRVFEAAAGKGTPGESYVSKYVFRDAEKTSAIGDIAKSINSQGFTFDASGAGFLAAAARVVRDRFYSGYVEATQKVAGVNLAEDAPAYPALSAFRIQKYWQDTYWPRERDKAAAAVVKALKLKKPAKTK